jgi:putative peptidoglycan lipid II flippase
MGHAGLALSTSAVAITGFVALFWMLRNRIGGIHGRALACDTARILAATAAMAGVVWLSSYAIQSWLGARKLGYLADVAVSVPLGAVVFFLAGRWLGIRELKLVRVRGFRLFWTE